MNANIPAAGVKFSSEVFVPLRPHSACSRRTSHPPKNAVMSCQSSVPGGLGAEIPDLSSSPCVPASLPSTHKHNQILYLLPHKSSRHNLQLSTGSLTLHNLNWLNSYSRASGKQRYEVIFNRGRVDLTGDATRSGADKLADYNAGLKSGLVVLPAKTFPFSIYTHTIYI